MKKRIVIVGAGGFGRGIHGWLMHSLQNRGATETTEIVFVDDGTPRVEPPEPVIATVTGYQPQAQDEVICAVAEPTSRRNLVERLSLKGAVFRSFVDDRVVVGSRVRIGIGVVVCPGTVISADATIGDHVQVNFNCSIGHDAVLSDYATLSPAANVMGEVQVGQGAFLGGTSVVLPRTRVGEWSTIAAGAVLVYGSEPMTVMAGNPARALPNKQWRGR